MGVDSGGKRAAALYSLISSAKPNGVDPQVYMHYVLTQTADHSVNRVQEPLPWNMAAQLHP